LSLERLLPVAPNHDHGQEAANNGTTEDDENDWDADGPDARQEEQVKEVVVVDKGHEQRPDGVVDEDGSGCGEHAEAHGAVEHGDDGERS